MWNLFQHAQSEAPAPGFKPFTGTGVCDVCNGNIGPGTAVLVPTKTFWKSRKYRNWIGSNEVTRSMLIMNGISADEFAELQARQDTSVTSAVCMSCVHLFE